MSKNKSYRVTDYNAMKCKSKFLVFHPFSFYFFYFQKNHNVRTKRNHKPPRSSRNAPKNIRAKRVNYPKYSPSQQEKFRAGGRQPRDAATQRYET